MRRDRKPSDPNTPPPTVPSKPPTSDETETGSDRSFSTPTCSLCDDPIEERLDLRQRGIPVHAACEVDRRCGVATLRPNWPADYRDESIRKHTTHAVASHHTWELHNSRNGGKRDHESTAPGTSARANELPTNAAAQPPGVAAGPTLEPSAIDTDKPRASAGLLSPTTRSYGAHATTQCPNDGRTRIHPARHTLGVLAETPTMQAALRHSRSKSRMEAIPAT